jgi:predicted transcriptional regulator
MGEQVVTVAIPSELEEAVHRKAEQRRVPVERAVQEALEWYLRVDTELLDELAAWQEVRDEAFEIVEGAASEFAVTANREGTEDQI